MLFSLITDNITTTDLKTSVETSRQSRPFEIVRCLSDSDRPLTEGYKGLTILKDSYYFANILFDAYVELEPGDRILLYGQNNPIENGIWSVISIVSGYVNIQRPVDYAKNTPIRAGQYILVTEGYYASGLIFKNITPEYDENQNKIIGYNGSSPQSWQLYNDRLFIYQEDYSYLYQ